MRSAVLGVVGLMLAGCAAPPRGDPMPDRTSEFLVTCRDVWQAELGRPVDPSGLEDCLQRARAGETKEQIAAVVHDSPDAQAYRERLVKSPVLPRWRIEGPRLVAEDGTHPIWAGVSGFQLVEQVAHGRQAEAEAFLAWAQRTGIVSVVRVLVMAKHLFTLPPAEGVRALPATLALAARYGLYVEAVALADTASYAIDLEAHVREVGAICDAAPNCVLELANEPRHETQDRRLWEPAVLRQLRTLVPARVPTALGAAHGADDESRDFAAGDYITVHGDRADGEGGWRWVRHTNEQRALRDEVRRVVVNDEPRRDDLDPVRQRAMAWLCRIFGLGDTFHYGEGRFARPPTGDELLAFEARAQGWRDIPPAWWDRYANTGFPGGPVRSFTGAVRAYSSLGDAEGYTLVLGAGPATRLEWSTDWPTRELRIDLGAAQLWVVRR